MLKNITSNLERIYYKNNAEAFEAFESLVDRKEPLMLDTETIGFYGTIRLAQFYQKSWPYPILMDYPDPHLLVSMLAGCTVVMQNAAYDITTIQCNLGKVKWQPKSFHCTLLLSRLAFPLLSEFNLFSLAEHLYREDNPYKGMDKKELQKSDWSAEELTEEQLTYAGLDVIVLQDLWDAVKAEHSSVSYQLDMIISRYCFDFQWNGLPLDEKAAQEQAAKNTKEIESTDMPINVNSYQQVRPYLGVDADAKTDDLALAALIYNGSEKAKNVRKVRGLRKQNSFIDKYIETQRNGKLYGMFSPTARSGRIICKNQNLLQNPRALKKLFGYEEGGDKVLVFSDFSQLELRCACAVIGDEIMDTLYREGEDLHTYTANMLFPGNKLAPPEVQDSNRNIAKTGNFHFLYGGGVNTFLQLLLKRAGIWLSESEAKKIQRSWRQSWPGIYQWQKEGIAAWDRKQMWCTPLGRYYVGKRLTDHLNIIIQGFGSEVAKLAWHYQEQRYKEMQADVDMNIMVHDSYIYSCPNDETVYKEVAKIMGESMQEAWTEGSKCAKIHDLPMPVDVRVGYNWGRIEKGEFLHQLKMD